MKGVVYNVLEEIVSREHGESTWDTLLDEAGVDGIYTSLGNYPDSELLAIVDAASAALGMTRDEVIRWFGQNALPLFAQRYPTLFEPHSEVRTFVLTLNEIIHPEVRKVYPGAAPPDFAFDASSPDLVVMDYTSARRLCAFAEGLLFGLADFYGERIAVTQSECMNRGDDRCRIEIATGT